MNPDTCQGAIDVGFDVTKMTNEGIRDAIAEEEGQSEGLIDLKVRSGACLHATITCNVACHILNEALG